MHSFGGGGVCACLVELWEAGWGCSGDRPEPPPASVFNIWCGGAFGNQLRGCGGKTAGQVSGLQQGEAGFQDREAVRNESAGRSKFRLLTPRVCAGRPGGSVLCLCSCHRSRNHEEVEGSVGKLREGSGAGGVRK